MSHSNHFDVIVIGSGPGGEGAAMGLTKAGLNVAIIEKESSVGGGCTHWGTIPSKALRHAVSRIIEFNNNPLFCQNNKSLHATFSDISWPCQICYRQTNTLTPRVLRPKSMHVSFWYSSFYRY